MINETNNSTNNETSSSSVSFSVEPPFDINASDNDKKIEKVSNLTKLQEAAARAMQYEFVAQLFDEHLEVKESKKGVELEWATVKVKQTSAKGTKRYKRSKPIFTDEGQMLVKNAPYDPDAYYRISVNKQLGGFSTWTNIEKVDG